MGKLLDARAERAIEALLVRGIAAFHSRHCAPYATIRVTREG